MECNRCRLKHSRKKIVYGKGKNDAKVMLIGEAPGKEEDIKGEPFVGRAGKLLDQMIVASKLKDYVYITNVVKCRPKNNRDPFNDEIETCRKILNKQIQDIDPFIIVCVGRISAQSLIDSNIKITKDSGKWYKLKAENGKIINATCMVHPAYILRRVGNDLKQIKSETWSILLDVYDKIKEGR